jgi:eukaryotic-like serine/threonine-protein kinase
MLDNERERRLEELHSGALNLDAGEREEFLRQGCGGDAELRHAVESLLGYEQKLDGFLEGPALPTETLDSAADRDQSQAGQTLGPYHLLEPIGAGGMGEVWLAEQRQPVRRCVAIKLIKAGMDTRSGGAFPIRTAGAGADGAPQHRQGLRRGRDAARPAVLRDGVRHRYPSHGLLRPAQRERLELFVHVCEGVQHAHQKAIIHRDLKPSNILVGEVDGRPVPQIIDFWPGQSHRAGADGRDPVHAGGCHHGNARIHESGASRRDGGCGHQDGCVLARGGAV